jgi:putative nucleotidyltransferase with HDIG domain
MSNSPTFGGDTLAAAQLDSVGEEMASSGYAGIVLARLASQAADLLAMDQSFILVRDLHDPTVSIVAAAHGHAIESIGRQLDEASARRRTRGATTQLCWAGAVQGMLGVSSTTGRSVGTRQECAVLRSIGEVVAAAVHHAHERAVVAPDLREPIRSLAHALDERDGYTAKHSHDVVATASAIALALGWDRAACAELEVAAFLHDIGKICVPDEILHKPGPLTAQERMVMARHPIIGAEILTAIPGLEVVANIVRYHHERWDGAGYPDGLSGGRIPLASRIIAACDAYNAMTSDRPYRNAMSAEGAVHELRRGAGRQFDPAVIAQLDRVLHGSVAA